MDEKVSGDTTPSRVHVDNQNVDVHHTAERGQAATDR